MIFDPNAQYSALTPQSDPVLAISALNRQRIVRYQPNRDVANSFNALVNLLWPEGHLPRISDLSIIIDECSYLQSPHDLHPTLERLLRLAPEDLRVIQTTHRLVDTHRLSRALATDFYLFQSKSGKDLELIQQEFESPELAQAVSNLGTYEVAHYTIGEGGERLFWVWRDPTVWHLPIKSN